MSLYEAARRLPPGAACYPSVFLRPAAGRLDPAELTHAGGFCFDTGTPLDATTLEAACWSAACAWEAAALLRRERLPLTYALTRPPGHHATREQFGGYCYLNNAALAARSLRRHGRVALLDVDFHHGNGSQELFYRDPRVLFISVHGDPRSSYPFVTGYAEETGAGRGAGCTINLPLPRGCDGETYAAVLERQVIPALRAFAPDYLVLSAGQDTYRLDPLGGFALEAPDFVRAGELLGRVGLPTVVVQEGGYHLEHLGELVRGFLEGLRTGCASAAPR